MISNLDYFSWPVPTCTHLLFQYWAIESCCLPLLQTDIWRSKRKKKWYSVGFNILTKLEINFKLPFLNKLWKYEAVRFGLLLTLWLRISVSDRTGCEYWVSTKRLEAACWDFLTSVLNTFGRKTASFVHGERQKDHI